MRKFIVAITMASLVLGLNGLAHSRHHKHNKHQHRLPAVHKGVVRTTVDTAEKIVEDGARGTRNIIHSL